TLNLGLRWEYGSPYSEQNRYVSNFDPSTQTVLTTAPGAVAGNGITPVSASGVYGNTLVHPDLNDFGPRVGFAYAAGPNTAIRGGFGVSFVHYTRAGSGDILAINAPQAQFASVTQPTPSAANHCASPLPAQIIAPGSTTPSCYATIDQGYPAGLVTTFNPATDNITWIPADTRDSYVESYYLDIQQQLRKNILFDLAYVGNHSLKLQGFLNGNQRNPSAAFARPYGNWPSDITEALNEFYGNYNALQARYEQRMVGGLTLLNSFTWQRSLDNASASLEGNTPSPQDANNLRADYAQSDYNLPVSNVTTLIYDLPFGRGRAFMNHPGGFVQNALGGWQVSLVNTSQSGTPFNIVYGPSSANQVSRQIAATYRGANEYRPNRVAGVPLTLGRTRQLPNTGYFQFINPAALTLPATGTATAPLSPFGNLGRNPARTTAFNETDLDFNKRFTLPVERLQLEFRGELYNLFNHTNLYLPSGTVSGTLGGAVTSGGQVSSTFQPRIVQFALKLIY
ncbi:MAG: TonB-dependent receptor, partial [Rhodospirillales bacterium]|nr:TonB-dependent receptor [Acetobacter sp.]